MDEAMNFFWRVLDVQGRLTVATISLFFREVVLALKEGGSENLHAKGVKEFTIREPRTTKAKNGACFRS